MKFISLRDWLIAILLAVAFILFEARANAQQIFPEANPTGTVKSRGGLDADSAMWIPIVNVKFIWRDSTRRLGYNTTDSSVYFHNGIRWIKLASINDIGGAGKYQFFLSDTSSVTVPGYKRMINPLIIGSESYITDPSPANGNLLQAWVTQNGTPGLTFIPAGIWVAHIHGYKTGGTKDVALYARFYIRNLSGTETLLGTTSNSQLLTTTEADLPSMGILLGDIVLSATDRLVVKFYESITGSGSVPSSIIVGYGDNTAARIEVPGQSATLNNFVPYSLAIKDVDLNGKKLSDVSLTAGYIWVGGSANTNTAVPASGDVASISPVGAFSFTTTGVTPGTYGNASNIPSFTVDAKGRLTAVSTYTFTTGSVTSVGLSAPSVFSVSGSPVTSSGTLALGFNGGQTANSFLATPNGSTGPLSLRTISTGDLPSTTAGYIWMGGSGGTTTAQPFSGDINSVSPTGAVTFSATGVTAGTYGNATNIPSFTVDAKGRLTAASTYTFTSGGIAAVTGSTPIVATTTSNTVAVTFQTVNPNSVPANTTTANATPSGSVTYASTNTNSALVQRDGSGNASVSSIIATSSQLVGATSGTVTCVPAATVTSYTWVPPSSIAASTGMAMVVTSISSGTVTTSWANAGGGGGASCSITTYTITPSSSVTIDGSIGVAAPCHQTYYLSLSSASTAVTITNISEGQLIFVQVYTNAQTAAVTTSAGTAYKVFGHYGGVMPVTQASAAYDSWTITKMNGTVYVYVNLDGT